ncbi:MAG: helix-turn-helix transcriptional regulator [bacterium]|nr:helix-turn-helix transcriptional regulator [bacterium]
MRKKRKTPFEQTGRLLKQIRLDRGLTLDDISKQIKISRSYLSDFERGIRLPTTKYLEYLHRCHNANLNYIFGSGPPRFREKPGEGPPNFGAFQPKIDRMLKMMKNHEILLHGILGASVELEFKHRELLLEMRTVKK